MKYKLLAIDLDDSLLGADHKISEENKLAVKRAEDKGVIVTIATGRPLESCLPYIKELDLDVPFITFNGGMVIGGKSMEVLYHKTIEPEYGLNILELTSEYKPTVLVFMDNKLYVNELNERTERYTRLSTMVANLKRDINSVVMEGPTKILLYNEPEKVKKMEKRIRDNMDGRVNFHISKPFFLEFINRSVSKGNALGAIAEGMGISSDEVIAIGDSFNDISMIEYAGLGVAVDNAYEQVKSKADYISKSNIDNGVAEVIEKFIMEG